MALRLSKVGSREVLFVVQSIGIVVCVLVTIASLFSSRFMKIKNGVSTITPKKSTTSPLGTHTGPHRSGSDKPATLSAFVNAQSSSEVSGSQSMLAQQGSVPPEGGDTIVRKNLEEQRRIKELQRLEKRLRRREKRIETLVQFIEDQGLEAPE